MGLAENIRALLMKEDISQNALAERIEVSPATVSRWLNGKMDIRPAQIMRLCAAFEITPDDLRSDTHGLAAQLAAQELGIEPADAPTVPLVPADRATEWVVDLRSGSVERVEVPPFVAEAHPESFAVRVTDGALGRVVPNGTHAVVDPTLAPRNMAIVLVELHKNGALTLRRWLKGNHTVVLATDGHEQENDIVLNDLDNTDGANGADSAAERPKEAQVLGTVVWYQAAELLG